MAGFSENDVGKPFIIKAKKNDKLIWRGILEKSYKAYEPKANGSVQNAIFKNVTGPGDIEEYVNFSSSDYTFELEPVSKGGRRLRKNKRNTLRSAKTLRKNARRGTRRWRE